MKLDANETYRKENRIVFIEGIIVFDSFVYEVDDPAAPVRSEMKRNDQEIKRKDVDLAIIELALD